MNPSPTLHLHRRKPMSLSSQFNAPRLLTAVALAALATASQAANPGKTWCADRCDQIVIDWNQQTHQVTKAAAGYQAPMAASRSLAMVHLAMHDAVNAAQPRYRTYADQPKAPTGKAGADAA